MGNWHSTVQIDCPTELPHSSRNNEIIALPERLVSNQRRTAIRFSALAPSTQPGNVADQVLVGHHGDDIGMFHQMRSDSPEQALSSPGVVEAANHEKFRTNILAGSENALTGIAAFFT